MGEGGGWVYSGYLCIGIPAEEREVMGKHVFHLHQR